jgi:transcriptional regulator with XRE-family HTH domain
MFVEKTPSADSQNLKTTRENLGFSLEDLFQKTRVSVVYLQAIESKEFDLLPVPVYARNFIKIYAKALRIDSEPLIREYEDYLNSKSKLEEPVGDGRGETFPPEKVSVRKKYLTVAFILTVVVVASLIFLKQCEISSDSMKQAETSEGFSGNNGGQIFEGLILSDRFWEGASGIPLTEKIIATPGENKPYSSEQDSDILIITATDETWLRVKADDSPPFEILLKAGEKFEQRAKKFSLDIGNAGGIKIKFKGKETANFGAPGEVIHLRLP